jgi:hypothetical protein
VDDIIAPAPEFAQQLGGVVFGVLNNQ